MKPHLWSKSENLKMAKEMAKDATRTGISFASGGALLGECLAGFTGAMIGALTVGVFGVVVTILIIRHASR